MSQATRTPAAAPPQGFFFVERSEVDQLIAAACAPLLHRLSLLESGLSEYVSTKEACKLTGLSAETLKLHRERPDTLIIVKLEGKKNSHPQYLRSSLIAFNEARQHRRRAGRVVE